MVLAKPPFQQPPNVQICPNGSKWYHCGSLPSDVSETSGRTARRFTSDSGASTKRISAPAAAKARARRKASSRPTRSYKGTMDGWMDGVCVWFMHIYKYIMWWIEFMNELYLLNLCMELELRVYAWKVCVKYNTTSIWKLYVHIHIYTLYIYMYPIYSKYMYIYVKICVYIYIYIHIRMYIVLVRRGYMTTCDWHWGNPLRGKCIG